MNSFTPGALPLLCRQHRIEVAKRKQILGVVGWRLKAIIKLLVI